MKFVTCAALFFALMLARVADASWLSKAVTNSTKTADKAVKDTTAEINRTKEKVINSGTPTAPAAVVKKDVAVAEIDRLGEKLKDAQTSKIEVEGEKKLADGIIVALVAAVVGE